MKTLIFGAGWLGTQFGGHLSSEVSRVDIADRSAVEAELERVKPTHILNTAGKTGRPNIDWCEDHKLETVSSNITGPLVLLRACLDRGIHLTHLSSGCIFDGAAPGPNGFTEEDSPNPVSFYSWTKAEADEILKRFPALILRLRMPIDTEPNQRNLITKLAGYSHVIDAINSVTVVADLLTGTAQLMMKGATGIFNMTNPDPVRHLDIMRWYTEIVDPSHAYTIIPAENLQSAGLTKTGRSNCVLDTSKLQSAGVHLRPAGEAIRQCLEEYKKHSAQQ
ncbi:MAG: sugar nucleotide-binding protein [Patescibacteria group bacterium]